MSILTQLKSSIVGIVTAALVAALVVAVPAPLVAQQKAAAAKASAAQTEEENEAAAPSKPGQEGIKVHGHWIIDVHDKDGKLVGHRDFQNSLQPGGGTILSALLTNQMVLNSYMVNVGDSNGGTYSIFPATTSTLHPYFAICGTNLPFCNANLTTTTLAVTGGLVGFKLAGQFTPTSSIYIASVATSISTCFSNALGANPVYLHESPADCALLTTQGSDVAYSQFPFTATNLATALSVAAGQVVTVSVTISFS